MCDECMVHQLMLLCSMWYRVLLFIDRIYYNIIKWRLCVEITVVLLLVFASISRRQSTNAFVGGYHYYFREQVRLLCDVALI